MTDDHAADDRSREFLGDAAAYLGQENVYSTDQIVARYGSTTTGTVLSAGGAVTPGTLAEVQKIVRRAAHFGVSLYTVSTGNNWGYGASSPANRRSVILDLRRLNRIDDSDIDLGVVTLEPGVTQQMLRDFLDANGYRFMVPVHGGGPSCSILGNCMERGYGITPHTDHFGAMTCLEAVLPDGELYRTPLTEQGAHTDTLFKWGVGPYLDGLFAQGAFGIVVRASIALAPIPAHVESFIFRVHDERDLPQAAEAVRDMLRTLPGVVHGVNLMNARRMLSMMRPYPREDVGSDGIISQQRIHEMARRNNVAPWTGFGALYGEKAVVQAAKGVIRRRLKGVAGRPLFIPHSLVRLGARALARFPAKVMPGMRSYVATLNKSLLVVEGTPAEIALPLAYWKQGGVGERSGLDPARDGRGIIWYAPLVPLRAAAIADYIAMADRVCRHFRIEPLMTLTSLSDRCLDSTVPILFDPTDRADVERAQDCYRALVEAGRALGFMPYRYPVHELAGLVDSNQPFWRMVDTLKVAIDPQRILSPGRYN